MNTFVLNQKGTLEELFNLDKNHLSSRKSV